MKEEDLLKIALVVSLGGLFLLAIFSAKIAAEEKSIEEINDFKESKTIRVNGIVASVKTNNESSVVEIEQSVYVKAVVFDPVNGLKKGDKISVEGKIDEYKGNKQILVEKIRLEK